MSVVLLESDQAQHKRNALLDRLATKFTVGDGCWEWTAYKGKNGYGQVRIDGRLQRAHRAIYELMVGPIPDGLHLDHLCRNRCCVRPDHLEPVTSRENVLRGETLAAENAAKTHCPKGHPYNEANTLIYKGRRFCRQCSKENTERRRGAVKAWTWAVSV